MAAQYKGERDANGLMTGSGELILPSGIRYSGKFERGLPNGNGTVEFPNGARYSGDFLGGKMEGQGMYEKEACNYKGQFSDSCFNGEGKITFRDNTTGIPAYKGVFKEGYFNRTQF